jgi:hypothetical protein
MRRKLAPGELPVEARHADQDHAQVTAVEEVAELFQAGGAEPIGFVDDHHLGAVHRVQLVPGGMAGRVQRAVDVRAERGRGDEQFQVHPTWRDADLGGVEHGAAGQQGVWHRVTLEVPLNGPPFPIVGGGVGTGGQSLSDTRCAVTDPDVPEPRRIASNARMVGS